MNSSNFDRTTQQTIPLHQQRNEVELAVLQAALADPVTLWPVAVSEGLEADHFEQPDARLMAEAIRLQHAGGRMVVLCACWSALAEAGLWNDEWPPADTRETCWWSPVRLVAWSRRYYVAPEPDMAALVACMAAALVELAERIGRAEALASEYFALLGEGVAA